MAAYAIPILILESLFHKSTNSKSIRISELTKQFNLERTIKKLLGLYFTYALLFLIYYLVPEYHYSIYKEYFLFIKYIGYLSLFLAIPYFMLTDAMWGDKDAYWILGSWLCFEPVRDRKLIIQHCLVWIIKGYFIPVNFINLVFLLNMFSKMDITTYFSDVHVLFKCSVILLFSIDFLVALVGYLLTLRLFDIHVRSADPTWFGWIICIICYQPFTGYLLYIPSLEDQSSWMTWITNGVAMWVWCFIILSLLLGYVLATISFGVRFSNLTHRGIITNGPYRLTKHPNYVFKNLFWWLAFFPFSFLMGNWMHTALVVMIMTVLNVVYYYRAKTEEFHLSKDPTYVQYALWINENGMFAPLAKRLPFLMYKNPHQETVS